MTIAQELTSLNTTKTAIATAIEGKGGNLTGIPFSGYAEVIDTLSTGGGRGGTPPFEWSEAYYQSVLANVGTYQRSRHWLTLPTMVDGDSKFIGLLAVYPNSNYVSLTAAGAFTVNWGDGTTQNFSANGSAERNIDYNAAALAGTNASVTIATDGTFTRANHGCVNGESIPLYSVVGVTEVVSDSAYYVRDVTTNTFKLSLTLGGAAITFAATGSAALLPYKQTIIQLTPQAAQTLTTVNIQRTHSQANNYPSSVNYLDIKVGGPSITSLCIGADSPGSTYQNIKLGLLEQIEVYRTGTMNGSYLIQKLPSLVNVNYFNAFGYTNLSYCFTGCTALKYINIQNTGTVTTMYSMFDSCYSLQTVPLFNTAAVTTMENMFSYCYSLQTVPLFNTAAVTSMYRMFYNCYSLQAVPLFNTAAVKSMYSMFYSCYSLQTVPLFNTAAVTTMSNMFSGCYSLQAVPLFNTAAVTTMTGMFYSCYSLQTVPLFNTAAVTTMHSMFFSCLTLRTVPLFNTAAVTTMTYMFYSCCSLQAVPLFNTAAVTTMEGMFYSCSALKSVPELNLTTLTSAPGSMFTDCTSLSRIKVKNLKQTISFQNCFLDAAALDEIYTNLPTFAGKTITVSKNPGVTADNPAIATAKGWTVTG